MRANLAKIPSHCTCSRARNSRARNLRFGDGANGAAQAGVAGEVADAIVGGITAAADADRLLEARDRPATPCYQAPGGT
jgi:hypothetical protein